jgi:hypothetical protein
LDGFWSNNSLIVLVTPSFAEGNFVAAQIIATEAETANKVLKVRGAIRDTRDAPRLVHLTKNVPHENAMIDVDVPDQRLPRSYFAEKFHRLVTVEHIVLFYVILFEFTSTVLAPFKFVHDRLEIRANPHLLANMLYH